MCKHSWKLCVYLQPWISRKWEGLQKYVMPIFTKSNVQTTIYGKDTKFLVNFQGLYLHEFSQNFTLIQLTGSELSNKLHRNLLQAFQFKNNDVTRIFVQKIEENTIVR